MAMQRKWAIGLLAILVLALLSVAALGGGTRPWGRESAAGSTAVGGAYDEEVLGWPDEITDKPLLKWGKGVVNVIVWNSYWGAYSTTVFSVDDTAPSQEAGKTGDPVPI